MDYHPDTAALIERQCRNVERADFVLDKATAQEAILKTYDLFNLARPKKVVWCKSPFEKKYQDSAGSAWSARSAWSAWSARNAGSAWSARNAGSAGSAWSAWSARNAGSAWSARNAGSAWSARSARNAGSAWNAQWSALDYDFEWYVYDYEYCKANTDWNENDRAYLDYCELLMQAKEAGAGYRVEFEGVLYIAPTPIVTLNSQGVWHSDRVPAIRWKDTKLGETHMLHGVIFPKDLWTKVVSKQMPFADILKIVDIDQRKQAMKYGNVWDFVKHNNGKELDTAVKVGTTDGRKIHYWLYEFPAGELFTKTVHYMIYEDSMLGAASLHMQGVPEAKTVAEAMAWKQSDELHTVTAEEWNALILDVDFA